MAFSFFNVLLSVFCFFLLLFRGGPHLCTMIYESKLFASFLSHSISYFQTHKQTFFFQNQEFRQHKAVMLACVSHDWQALHHCSPGQCPITPLVMLLFNAPLVFFLKALFEIMTSNELQSLITTHHHPYTTQIFEATQSCFSRGWHSREPPFVSPPTL